MTTIDPNLFHGCDVILHLLRPHSPLTATAAHHLALQGVSPPISSKISGIDGGYRPYVPAVSKTTWLLL